VSICEGKRILINPPPGKKHEAGKGKKKEPAFQFVRNAHCERTNTSLPASKTWARKKCGRGRQHVDQKERERKDEAKKHKRRTWDSAGAAATLEMLAGSLFLVGCLYRRILQEAEKTEKDHPRQATRRYASRSRLSGMRRGGEGDGQGGYGRQ